MIDLLNSTKDEKAESRKSTATIPLTLDKFKTPNLLGLESRNSEFPSSKSEQMQKSNDIRGFNILSMPSPSPNSRIQYLYFSKILIQMGHQ